MKTLLSLLLLACAAHAVAEEAPKPLRYVKEGTYFASMPNSTNILELKGGRFQQWVASTRGRGGLGSNPDNQPRTAFSSSSKSGDYTTNGGTVKFVVQGGSRRPFITNEFMFMEFRGKVMIWTPAALQRWNETKGILPLEVMEATDRKPEAILGGK